MKRCLCWETVAEAHTSAPTCIESVSKAVGPIGLSSFASANIFVLQCKRCLGGLQTVLHLDMLVEMLVRTFLIGVQSRVQSLVQREPTERLPLKTKERQRAKKGCG